MRQKTKKIWTTLTGRLSLLLIGIFCLFVIGLLAILEFGVIEKRISANVTAQGTGFVKYFYYSIRNHLLSGFREGVNKAAENLVATGECQYVKIFDKKGEMIVSCPLEPIENSQKNEEDMLTENALHFAPRDDNEVLVQNKAHHFDFALPIYFDEDHQEKMGIIRLGISQEKFHEAVFVSRVFMLVLGLLTLALFATVTLIMIRRGVAQPIHKLSQSVENLVQGGSPQNLKPEEFRYEELREFSKKAKEMAMHIKNAEEIIERKSAAEAMGELMQDFAHGVRTPISNIQKAALNAFEEIGEIAGDATDLASLRKEIGTLASQKNDALHSQVIQINSFINRVLDFTKPIQIQTKPTNMFNLVEDVLNTFRNKTLKKKMTFANQIDPILPLLNVDKAYILEVFQNLIENSVDAVDTSDHVEEGIIQVSSHYETSNGKASAKIIIADNGCGIPESDLKKIFKPHFSTKKERGNGRGLAIVQRLLDKHGASIQIESEVLKGTKMILKFSIPREGVEAC